jgi:glutamyl-tRNA synthetase
MPSHNYNLKVRIPPSPTGPLHLGTARTALYNFLFIRKHGGRFVFRLEDTDRERSKSEYVDDIINGLKWLGITWDEGPLRQSEHIARHQFVVRELLAKGQAYECFCSQEELTEIRQAQRAMNQVEGYDNRHRTLTDEQKQEFKNQGRKAVIRFKLPDQSEICWDDLIRGKMVVNTSDLGGDPVIAKDNGDVLYNFAVVIDDHDAGITQVIRGEDHLHNTAKQIPIFEAMGWDIPEFAHVPLILTSTREKLSKRKHGDIASIAKYIHEGYLPEAISNYLIAMSWQFKLPSEDSTQAREVFTVAEATSVFELKDISKSAAIYDPQKLHWFCKEHFKLLTATEVFRRAKPFLEAENLNLAQYSEEHLLQMISLVKDGLNTLSEIPHQLKFFFKDINFHELEHEAKECLENPEAKHILIEFLTLVSETDTASFDKEKANELLAQLAEKTKIKKGKKLFWPLRSAISGNTHGPDLVSILSILGIENLILRTKKALDFIG